MDERQPVLLAVLDRFLVGLVVIRAVQDDVSSVGASGGYFRQWRGERHENPGLDAVSSSVVGHALSVIAG